MATYDLTFTLTTEDLLQLQVASENQLQAVENALNRLSKDLNSNQTLQLAHADILPERPASTNGYTSLASLYAAPLPAPEPPLPNISGYNRLVN